MFQANLRTIEFVGGPADGTTAVVRRLTEVFFAGKTCDSDWTVDTVGAAYRRRHDDSSPPKYDFLGWMTERQVHEGVQLRGVEDEEGEEWKDAWT